MTTPLVAQARAFAVAAHADQGQLEVAPIVKAADRLATVRACVQDRNERLLTVYRNEHPVIRQAAYRRGLCDGIWAERDGWIG